MVVHRISRLVVHGLALAVALAGCAGHPPLPPPAALPSPLTGRVTPGVIAAIRPADASTPADVSAVLAALRLPAAAAPPPAVEILIRRGDGSDVAMVVAATQAQSLAPGQKILIIEAAATVLRPQ